MIDIKVLSSLTQDATLQQLAFTDPWKWMELFWSNYGEGQGNTCIWEQQKESP